jgi:hypothetical protein
MRRQTGRSQLSGKTWKARPRLDTARPGSHEILGQKHHLAAIRATTKLAKSFYFAFNSSSNSRSAATQSEVSSPTMPRVRRRSPIK